MSSWIRLAFYALVLWLGAFIAAALAVEWRDVGSTSENLGARVDQLEREVSSLAGDPDTNGTAAASPSPSAFPQNMTFAAEVGTTCELVHSMDGARLKRSNETFVWQFGVLEAEHEF